jgi:F0F1-type ATP synthase membrane subunit b/b'
MAQEHAKNKDGLDLVAEMKRVIAQSPGPESAGPQAGISDSGDESKTSPPLPPTVEPSSKLASPAPPPIPLTTRLEAAGGHPLQPEAEGAPDYVELDLGAAQAEPSPGESESAAAASDHRNERGHMPDDPPFTAGNGRRQAKRRAAAPSRDHVAANDDAPSIGGLIYALNQQPSSKPFAIAGGVSIVWALITIGFSAFYWATHGIGGGGLSGFLARPEFLMLLATILGPAAIAFGIAMLAYRSEEMRLRSSAMTEVAVRLAEPDRMAEQSVASLGQAVRRQVSFMNDAVTRALGRAGELEALVHSEVSALERSYEDNERKIRSLIHELHGERDALVVTSDHVTDTLRALGSEVPDLIEKLSGQQIKLAKIIEGAGQNLISLETAIASQTDNLETTLGSRTEHLQSVLTEYTSALSGSLDQRMEQIGTTIASRTGDLQVVFEEYTRALDTTLAGRSEALDQQFENQIGTLDAKFEQRAIELDATIAERTQQLIDRSEALDVELVGRTQALDNAFSERLRSFDEAIMRSTLAIDQTVGEKTELLTAAMEVHAKSLGDTLARQSVELDENLMQGISAVRRTSENITRQSIKAIEGLAGQSELLKNVSENLLNQINSITNRFDNQGQQIVRAANALETANYKIDKMLQNRHAELSDTLDRMSGKADELGSVAQGYSRQIEGSISEAEKRARSLTAELAQTTEERSRTTIENIERLKAMATDNTTRALEDLRARFSNVSQEVAQSLGTLTSKFTETSGDVRRRTAEAAEQLAGEQERLRAQALALPGTTRESAESMRRALQDQLRALDHLSSLTRREANQRDVSRPVEPPQAPRQLVPVSTSPATREEQARALSTLSSALSQEMQSRTKSQSTSRPASQGRAASSSAPTASQQAPAAPSSSNQDSREHWSLGDLLKRASLDEEPSQAAPSEAPTPNPSQQQAPQAGASMAAPPPAAPHPGTQSARPQHSSASSPVLDIAAAARALDPAVAADIWHRLGAGQRGIMVRSIYTAEGRALFDETVTRLRADQEFAQTSFQFLMDFERVLQESERQDPTGALAQGHLSSDYGRVYLFLAHASGRIG